MELVKNNFKFTPRKRKWVILLALCGFSSYGAYTVYHLPSVSRKRARFVKLLGALASIVETMADSAETLSIVSKDLKAFLESDSDQIPNSLKQLSKITTSDEFTNSLTRVSKAMTLGIIRGYHGAETVNEIGKVENSSLPDQIMDKMMSKAGTGFVSVVVGSFARNLVLGFYSNQGLNSGLKLVAPKSSGSTEWLDVLSNDKSKSVIADCIKTFVGTAVAVYLDKTTNINFYDDLFSGLTDPKHQKQVGEILVSVCNGAVETLIKTSHQVMTASNPSNGTKDPSGLAVGPTNGTKDAIFREKEKVKTFYDIENSGWVSRVSSTLSVPSNKRFVLDVTGQVTFQTIRSVVKFLLWKVSDLGRRGLDVVHEEVVGRGLAVVHYVGAKSAVIITICLALYLHVLGGNRAFLAA